MAKVILLLLCLTIIQASFALKCKTCKDTKDNECKELEDASCESTLSPDREPACLTLVYKDANQKTIVEKKCVKKIKNKEFECQIPPNSKQEKCEVCMEDGCNEKSAAAPVTVATLAVVASLLVHRLM